MFRSFFNKTKSITPEDLKLVEDRLESKEKLLSETSRQLEQTKRELRDANEKVKISQQKQESATQEVATLKQQLRIAKQESTSGPPLAANNAHPPLAPAAAVAPAVPAPPAAISAVTVEEINAMKKELAALRIENKQLRMADEGKQKVVEDLLAVLVRPSSVV